MPRKPKTQTKKTYKKKSTTSQSLKRLISKTIDNKLMKKAETKIAACELAGVNFNATINSITDLYNIIPSIVEGTGDDDRVGNSIVPLYTNIRGYCTWAYDNTYYSTLGPLDVQMFILRNKTQKDSNMRATNTDTYIIKRGIYKQQYDGTMNATTSPINTEDFQIIMKKSFRLTPMPTTNISTTPIVSQNVPQNPLHGSGVYKFKYVVDWKKCGIDKFIYDYNQQFPSNENVFFCLGFAQYNEPAIAVPDNNTPVQVSWTATTYYKDM